jgi:competence protein ComEC
MWAATVQQRLLRTVGPAGLRADVTTVAHHGSADQLPAFYAAVGARVAVASAGRDNSYGHPTDRARDVVAGSGARVLSTATDGDIALRAVAAPDGAAATAGPAGPPTATAVGVRTSRRRARRPAGDRPGGTCRPSVPA